MLESPKEERRLDRECLLTMIISSRRWDSDTLFEKRLWNCSSTNSPFRGKGIRPWMNSPTHKHYLLEPNESSELFAVDRKSRKVRLKSREDLEKADFVKEYFPDKEYLNSVVEHDPKLLLARKPLSSVAISFQGLPEPSEDSEDWLRFSRVRKSSSSGDASLASENSIQFYSTSEIVLQGFSRRTAVRGLRLPMKTQTPKKESTATPGDGTTILRS